MDGACPQTGYCDFEKFDSCTWSNDQSEDDFDWTLGSGTTPSGGTGPSVDHTTGLGISKYLYIEASRPRQTGHKARLVGERLPSTSANGYCVKFWYHMSGSAIGTLNVLVKTALGNQSETVMWSLSGNQQNKWLYAQAPVVSTLGGFQVRGLGRQYVFDVTFVGQRSSPWLCKLSERRDEISA